MSRSSETTMSGGNGMLRLVPLPRRAFPDFIDGSAACHGSPDPDAFTEEGTTKAGRARTEYAKAVCQTCPLKVKCLLWAIDKDALGVWGGTTTQERKSPAAVRLALITTGGEENA